VYPRLAWFAAQDAVRSLIRSRPRPTAAIIGSDVEALVFGLLRRLLRLDTLIVFQSLIITPRRTLVARALSRGYFAVIVRVIDLGICHSRGEREDYRALLVEIGDISAMRTATLRLMTDAGLRQRIGTNARERFERENSTEAYIRNVVAAVGSALAQRISDRSAGQL
jgi:glycosyltransferase involved in cell wall biosynthesis